MDLAGEELVIELLQRCERPHTRTMRTHRQRCQPSVVRTGVLTQEEFDGLSSAEQTALERATADLIERYGEAFLTGDRERHRQDLRVVGFL
jgi:hypothetical protein